MIRKMTSAIFLLFLGVILSSQIPAHSFEPDQSHISIIRGYTAVRIELLHRLMIGKVSDVEHSLARDIAFDIKEMSHPKSRQLLNASANGDFSKLLVLVAVMNEKMDVSIWKDDPEFLSLVSAEANSNPDFADKLRCKDWSRQMWVGDDCT